MTRDEEATEAYHEGLEEGFKQGLKAARPSARYTAAVAVMQGLVAGGYKAHVNPSGFAVATAEPRAARVAEVAVEYADALLAELAKGGDK